MPWFYYSLLTSLSFVGMILAARRLADKGFSSKQVLFFLHIFTLLGFIVLNLIDPGDIWQSDKLPIFLAAMMAAGIFAFFGNWADFEGIKRAANPGYPVAIRNATILPVVLLSVTLFNSPLSLFKFFGALLIVAGIFLLVIERNSNSFQEKTVYPWYIFAFLALFGFTVMVLFQKQALVVGGATIEVNLLMTLINFLGFSFICRKDLKDYFSSSARLKEFLPLVLMAAAFSFIANFLGIKGLALAPNPGYHEAIKNTNAVFVALFAIVLIRGGFDKLKILGVILVTLGIIALVI